MDEKPWDIPHKERQEYIHKIREMVPYYEVAHPNVDFVRILQAGITLLEDETQSPIEIKRIRPVLEDFMRVYYARQDARKPGAPYQTIQEFVAEACERGIK
jgi:hypothetical protein